ncbi:MAG: sterol desaturase family protein, partial [Deltaproteobacteria bacterium]
MTIAIGALVLALLERVERLRFRASPLWRAHAASDVIYLLTGYVAGGSLALAYIVATSDWLGRIGLPRLAAPRWASVPLALVALDLGNYTAHWLLHRVDVLWEFHKAHHSSPTLDWLATFRSHLV